MLVDWFGPRRVILVGVVLLALASLLGATVHVPWQLYLYTGVLGAMGIAGLGWVPMGVLLSRWFSERRGRAIGIAFSGMGVGIFVIGPLAQWLIAQIGWRAASATLGAGALLILLPLVYLGARDPDPRGEPAPAPAGSRVRGGGTGRERGPRPGPVVSFGSPDGALAPDPSLRAALGTREFWALWAAYFLTPLAVFPVATHQVAFAIDLGFAPMLAATVFGLMGLMSSLGRPAFGVVADRFGGPLSATISFGCTAGGALSLVALEASPGGAWLVTYALLFGLGFGARGPIITAMASDRFGGRRFGAIYGALNLGNGIGAAVGPWFGGAVHDASGSYRIAFLSSVAFSALASVCFWVARRRAP